MFYPPTGQPKTANGRLPHLFRLLLLPVAALLALPGCGMINPNFETLWNPASETYMIEGNITRGFAAFPRVAYVQGQGESPDQGSFRNIGQTGAGIQSNGIYVPSEVLTLDSDNRFKKTFRAKPTYALIKLFAWDDTNRNGVRDLNEAIAGEFQIKKEGQRGWSFNAPNWNLFNFTFTK